MSLVSRHGGQDISLGLGRQAARGHQSCLLDGQVDRWTDRQQEDISLVFLMEIAKVEG